MKTIISGALAATVVALCLTLNVQAKSLTPVNLKASVTAVSDTGKMKMAKMEKKKMAKMEKKKMAKMEKGKMDKMKKDSAGKM